MANMTQGVHTMIALSDTTLSNIDVRVLRAKIEMKDEIRDDLMNDVADAVIKAMQSGMSDKDIAMILLRKACEVMG